MKKIFISKIVIGAVLLGLLGSTACTGSNANVPTEGPVATATEAPAPTAPPATATPAPTQAVYVDYAGALKLDMNSNTFKLEVTVKNYVDGDTVHFNVPTSVISDGILKARFMGCNTPESTGKIEDYGKAASRFTKEKLKNAQSIIIESDDEKLNTDSTGGRYLMWIWYKPQGASDYRNLNVELLQEGLAIASGSANNRYGVECMKAINTAKACKLKVYSGVQDPEIYHGEAIELTMKELRLNIADYDGKKVAFEGVITLNDNNSVYLEEYDEETGLYYGMTVFYGYGLSGEGLDILHVGNRARIVGICQYYENGGTYQIADVSYRAMKPNDPNNLQLISQGHSAAFFPIDPDLFVNGTLELMVNDTLKKIKIADCLQYTTVSMDNLKVTSVYTTTTEGSSSKGAMTLTCETVGGLTIDVRTNVFYHEDGTLMTKDDFMGKTISVQGLVEYYSGGYQIKVLTPAHVTIKN